MAAYLFPFFTLCFLWLFLRLWRLRKSSEKRAAGVLALQLVIFSWTLEALILSAGRFLGEGELLLRLSQVRLLLRGLFVPLLMVTVLEFAQRAQISWSQNKVFHGFVWLVSLVMMGFNGIVAWQSREDLVLKEWMGATEYAHANDFLPFLNLLTFLVIAILGVLIFRKLKWVWVSVGGLIAFAGHFVSLNPAGPLLAVGTGVILIGCLVATENRLLTPDYALSEGELESRISRVAVERSKKS